MPFCRFLPLFAAYAAVFALSAHAATDPRVCQNTAAACGKQAAAHALVFVGRHGGAVACRGFAGLLRYRCGWANAVDSGYAIVTFAPRTWKPTVAVQAVWTCAQRHTPSCRE